MSVGLRLYAVNNESESYEQVDFLNVSGQDDELWYSWVNKNSCVQIHSFF